MDYELAKELKDAGFPETKALVVYGVVENSLPHETHACEFTVEAPVGGWIPPTLSELIEACNTRVGKLVLKNKKTPRADCWKATKDVEHVGFLRTDGKTPEEAVARLWLALNT